MRLLLFAPNGGASLSYGGGTQVLLRHAVQLAVLGHEVHVAGFHSLARPEIESLHGVNLPASVFLHEGAGGRAVGLARRLPWKLSAYNLLLSDRFRRWMERTIGRVDPHAVWFHDDIPTAALAALAGRRVFLYVHYPLLARRATVTPPLGESRSLSELANDELLLRLCPVVAEPSDICEEIWVNSSVTQSVVRRLWACPTTLQPPSAPSPSARPTKRPVILSVGTFSLGKNLGPLVEAFARVRPEGWTLKLVGHARDAGYLRRLRSQVGRLQRAGLRAELGVDLSRSELEHAFGEASILAHPAEFEPFGLSVLQGMSWGGVPIAHAGAFCGAWNDLLDRGRFGPGFVDAEELTECLDVLSHRELVAPGAIAHRRAVEFSADAERRLAQGFDRLFGTVGA